MMKRIICIVCVLALLLSCAACGSRKTEPETPENNEALALRLIDGAGTQRFVLAGEAGGDVYTVETAMLTVFLDGEAAAPADLENGMILTFDTGYTLLETWPVAGAFLEQPVEGSAKTVERRLQQFGKLAESLDAPWQVIVPRTHGWLLRGRMNGLLRMQYETEDEIYGALEADGHFLDVLPAGTNPEEVYYRTDHHWNLEGAYRAYEAACRSDGLPVLSPDDFERSRFTGFYGTTRSRSGLPAFSGDVLDCAEPAGNIRMTLEDGETSDHLIFPEQAETYDGYAVYLNGNHGMAEIMNPDAPGGTLLVYKDSFANCLLPLLAADYSRIVAVDARYYAGSFSEAAASAGKVDKVLFVYSPDSLVNDTAVAGKAGR